MGVELFLWDSFVIAKKGNSNLKGHGAAWNGRRKRGVGKEGRSRKKMGVGGEGGEGAVTELRRECEGKRGKE